MMILNDQRSPNFPINPFWKRAAIDFVLTSFDACLQLFAMTNFWSGLEKKTIENDMGGDQTISLPHPPCFCYGAKPAKTLPTDYVSYVEIHTSLAFSRYPRGRLR